MDGFFEKFSLYDFFNLLIVGFLFLMGIHLLDIITIQELIEYISMDITSVDASIITIAILLSICYLIGTLLQQLGSFVFEKRYSKKIIGNTLSSNSEVLTNTLKLDVHRANAREIFHHKGIPFHQNQFTDSQSEYYFAYCSYYIQVKGKQQKPEKMRALRGIYSLFVTCFGLLSIVALLKIFYIYNCSQQTDLATFILPVLESSVFMILTGVYYPIYRENTKYWARMVLGVYEACADIDNQSKAHEDKFPRLKKTRKRTAKSRKSTISYK